MVPNPLGAAAPDRRPGYSMADATLRSLPTLEADLLLLHAPAHFEFRDRADIYFPFLGTSGDVPITPLYEYFPVGFKTLHRWLTDRGHDVRILNLSTLLLRFPHLGIDQVLGSIRVGMLGIDLHWMVHVQGSLEIARLFKAAHSDTRDFRRDILDVLCR